MDAKSPYGTLIPKVWITKYALTQGILEVANVEDCGDGMVVYRHPDFQVRQYAHRGEWHRTLEEAQKRAEDLVAAKIRSLQAQVEKLKKRTTPVVVIHPKPEDKD